MKHFILSALMLLVSCTIMAQEQEHLKFMGVPITGTEKAFIAEMKAKGFTRKHRVSADVYIMSGRFAGQDADIWILSDNKIVGRIIVDFPQEFSFPTLESTYNDMIAQFKIKYGEPDTRIEKFNDPYYDTSNELRIQALRCGECNYSTYWHQKNGGICVRLGTSPNLQIWYYDKDAIDKNEQQEIQNDI